MGGEAVVRGGGGGGWELTCSTFVVNGDVQCFTEIYGVDRELIMRRVVFT